MSEDVKSITVLLLVSVISGLILAAIYNLTLAKVKDTMLKERNKAILAVLPEKGLTLEQKGGLILAKKKGKVKYLVKVVKSPGYSSMINMAVGVTAEGQLTGIKIILQQETPGLGANCEKPEFYGQFAGKDPSKISIVKGPAKDNEISAITGATISSRAVLKGVKTAYMQIKKEWDVGNGN